MQSRGASGKSQRMVGAHPDLTPPLPDTPTPTLAAFGGPLRAATPDGWLACALGDVGGVLLDHAHCEKKAAAHAMALVAQYGTYGALVLPLTALAQEELRHFRQVFALLRARGIELSQDRGDPYVRALLRTARDGPEERLVDRLLLSSLVEARSAERLALLGQGFADAEPSLAPFYQRLARTEAGHYRLFVRLAKKLAPAREVHARLAALAEREAAIMLEQPLLPRIH